jgi:hypothetical protein
LITILEKMRVIVGEMSYALAVVVAMLFIPFALVLRAVVELQRHQVAHRGVKLAQYNVGLHS